jgi:hypothetical protein
MRMRRDGLANRMRVACADMALRRGLYHNSLSFLLPMSLTRRMEEAVSGPVRAKSCSGSRQSEGSVALLPGISHGQSIRTEPLQRDVQVSHCYVPVSPKKLTHTRLCEEVVQPQFSSRTHLAAICRITQPSNAASTHLSPGTTKAVDMNMCDEVMNFAVLSVFMRLPCVHPHVMIRIHCGAKTALPA